MVRFIWILVGIAIGIAAGWAITGKFSPEWVGAIGTCVGAVGTIAAILWAVHTFQHQSRERQEDLGRANDNKRKQEFELAVNVEVRASGGAAEVLLDDDAGRETHSLINVWIRLINGASEPATILHFELPDIVFRGNIMRILPSTLPAGETFRENIDVEPALVSEEEVSDRGPLKHSLPVLRYRIGGVTWERVGSDPPLRCA